MQDNSFEKFPGTSPEVSAERAVPLEQDFAKNFAESVPEFGGNNFGIAHKSNDYYGESIKEDSEKEGYNNGVADAALLINYGLDAIAREKGVEAVVQGIKSFDATDSDNPLKDLYDHLGIDTKEEFKDIHDESMAAKSEEIQFRDAYNMPKTEKRTCEGMLKAIADMKELIAEVESADPRYEELRNSAKTFGKGYFEYAVKDFRLQGLTDLFAVLAEQKEKKEAEKKEGREEVPEAEEDKKETGENGNDNHRSQNIFP